MLTSLKGDEWKLVRSTFSPIFTSGKMKGMLGFVKATSDNLVKELDKFANGTEEAECKKIYGCYTMDGLASAAFGMEINSFEKVRPGISPLFFNQNIEQNAPEKKIPSTAAKAINLSAKLGDSIRLSAQSAFFLIAGKFSRA